MKVLYLVLLMEDHSDVLMGRSLVFLKVKYLELWLEMQMDHQMVHEMVYRLVMMSGSDLVLLMDNYWDV